MLAGLLARSLLIAFPSRSARNSGLKNEQASLQLTACRAKILAHHETRVSGMRMLTAD